jgi:hypothetical protein
VSQGCSDLLSVPRTDCQSIDRVHSVSAMTRVKSVSERVGEHENRLTSMHLCMRFLLDVCGERFDHHEAGH